MNIEDIWRFISDLNNWAPLVPGYEQHKMIDHKSPSGFVEEKSEQFKKPFI